MPATGYPCRRPASSEWTSRTSTASRGSILLYQQLRRLPPSTHPHAIHAACPKLDSESTLSLSRGDHDATSATLALNTIAASQENPPRLLIISKLAYLATLQARRIPDDFVAAFTRACAMGVKDVALDFRDSKDSMTMPGDNPWAIGMDPSAMEGMPRGLSANTALEGLHVRCSEDGHVAAFLEGGGRSLQLKTLKLDIEGPCIKAALQALAKCTALTSLVLKCSLSCCFMLAASLQCMTQLQELYLTLSCPPKQASGPAAEALASRENCRKSELSGYMDPLLKIAYD